MEVRNKILTVCGILILILIISLYFPGKIMVNDMMEKDCEELKLKHYRGGYCINPKTNRTYSIKELTFSFGDRENINTQKMNKLILVFIGLLTIGIAVYFYIKIKKEVALEDDKARRESIQMYSL